MTNAEKKYLLSLYIDWTKRNTTIPKRRLEEKMREIVGDEVVDVISYVKNAVHSQNQLGFIKFCNENGIKVVYPDNIPSIKQTNSVVYDLDQIVVNGISHRLHEIGCNILKNETHIFAL